MNRLQTNQRKSPAPLVPKLHLGTHLFWKLHFGRPMGGRRLRSSARSNSTVPWEREKSLRSAFTLTELLVSMAILAALILLLFSVVDGTTKVWSQSEQRVDAFREARAALFIIARDLQTMVPSPDFGPEPYPTPGFSPTPLPTPNGVPDFRYFFINPPPDSNAAHVRFTSAAPETYGQRLFFLTAQPSSQGSGEKSDVCAVGYYLDYTAPPAHKVFKLYRYFRGSNATFDTLKNYVRDEPPTIQLMNANSSLDEVLARNVVDFRVTAYDRDFKKIDIAPSNPDFGRITPHAVDLSITAYNYSAANRFIDEADWMNFTSAKNAPSRQTFSTRVYLSRGTSTPTPTP